MVHLTSEEMIRYMNIDLAYLTQEEAALAEKVHDHLDECDECYTAFHKARQLHSMSEFFAGEPIPISMKQVSLTEALVDGDIDAIANAALGKLLDSVDTLSDSLHSIYSQLMSRGYTLVQGFEAAFAPSLPVTMGEAKEPAQIFIDESTNCVELTESGQIIMTFTGDAHAALIVSEDGKLTEIYEFLPLYGINTAITEELPQGSYRVIALNTADQ